jgi:hypothetical protein
MSFRQEEYDFKYIRDGSEDDSKRIEDYKKYSYV